MIRRNAVKNTDNPPGQIKESEWSKKNLVPKEIVPTEVMMSDLARDEYNRIGHTEYMKKYRKE